jgi:hypothetical protein
LGVALMLAALYRPAFALVPLAPRSAPAPAARPAGGLLPTDHEPVATARPVSERVRTTIVPTALKIEEIPQTAAASMTPDPWVLFDGDGATMFETDQAVRIHAALPADVAIEGIGIYGSAAGVVTVYAEGSGGPKVVDGLQRVSLSDLSLRWNRFAVVSPVETSAMTLEIMPLPGKRADVREIEIWARAAATAPVDTSPASAITDMLQTRLPAGAVQMPATPDSASISAPEVGTNGSITFEAVSNRSGRTFERAFLVYELEGMAHWTGVIRRINGQAAQGGFHADHVARGGLQVEEISPAWLRAGKNQIDFLVANRNDPLGYKVKHVRIVGVPASGKSMAYLPASAAGNAAASLMDDNPETGVTSQELRGRGQIVDLRFAAPSQPDSLLVSIGKGAKGTITAAPVVHGKLRGKPRTIDLDTLKAGWNRLALDDGPTDADGVRLTMDNGGEDGAGALVSEVRVTGSALPHPHASGLTVAYPQHDECVDGETYVRGFLRADGTGSVAGSTLRVDGVVRPNVLGPDGAFSTVVTPPQDALNSGKKWHVELEATFANGDSTGAVVEVEGCHEPTVATPSGPVEDVGAPFGQWVRAGQAAKLAFAGATLDIPAGALEKDTRITFRPIGGVEVPATDETMTNVTPNGLAYRLGPHGLKFEKPVSLTLPYDRARFVGGQAEDDLGAYYFDEVAKRWTQVQTLRGDGRGHTLTAATQHFTDFIAATISTPDHPTADSFNPNSIKDLKAADPAAGIDLIAPPEASSDGSAHLSFPIWVPPGRLGLQPSLAATYSSEAGNGLLGMGWDLPISSIQVDTRFGVPTYSTAVESETYTLDGDILVMDPGQTARGTTTSFHRRSEGRFDTIIRNGPADPLEHETPSVSGLTYHWEVIDKHGTHYVYGDTENARGSMLGSGVYRWYLHRVTDAFGNSMIYTYDKRVQPFHPMTTPASTAQSVEVYPKSIQYTLNNVGQEARYEVDFELNNDGQPGNPNLPPPTDSDHAQRGDAFSNARGGTIAFTQYRLINIRVRLQAAGGNGQLLRRYNFQYHDGAFGKSLLDTIRVCLGEDGDVDFANGGEVYRHGFTYSTLDTTPSFSTTQTWGSVSNGGPGLFNSSGENLNGTLIIGGGPGGCDLFHGIVGGSTSIDIANDDTTVRGFVDVNGDGLPDFVGAGGTFLNGGNINIGGITPQSFVATPAFTGPTNVGHVSHTSLSLQGGFHAILELARGTVEQVWASSHQDALLSDLDGDGFIDYISSASGAFLNRGSGFSSSATPWTLPPPTGTVPNNIAQLQKQAFTLTDPTIRWVAPFSGHVRITGAAQKAPNAHAGTDGVVVLIQSYTNTAGSRGGTIVTQTSNWSQTLTDSTPCTPADVPAISGCGTGRTFFVKTGDRIYFRSDAIDDINDDAVAWNPNISYQDVTDDSGGNLQTVTTHALQEPFATGAFDFNQAADFHLAGLPMPVWRDDSAGDATTPQTIHITGDVTKAPTSDAVTVEILRYPKGTNPPSLPVTVPSPLPTTPLAATSSMTIPLDFTTSVSPGDRIVFHVSSPTPIDPGQVMWSPHVSYVGNYCRLTSVGATTTKNVSPMETTFCGDIQPSTSPNGAGQFQLSGDPDPSNNIISATIVNQNIAPYYELAPWVQFGPPAGFVAPSDGTVTFTGTYVGPAARLVVRSLNGTRAGGTLAERLPFDAPVSAASTRLPITTPGSPGFSFNVTAGESILFDVFAANQSIIDGAAWQVSAQFVGTSGSTNQTIFARRNFQLSATVAASAPESNERTGGGLFHGWSAVEWNGSQNVAPDPTIFSDVTVQSLLDQGPGAIGQNASTNTPASPPPVLVMRESPQGLAAGPGASSPAVPGPLWIGGGVDGFIGAGTMKPSRLGRPTSGSSIPLSSTSNSSTAFGLGLVLGVQEDESTSETASLLIDVNGDRYPDLVTNGTIRFNQVVNPGAFDPSPTLQESGSFSGETNIFDETGGQNALSDLNRTEGHQAVSSVGISSAVGLYFAAKYGTAPPKWASVLPTLGIGYGFGVTTQEFLDINGDGLPDQVLRDPSTGKLTVRMNIGYTPDGLHYAFTRPLDFGSPSWETSGSTIQGVTFNNSSGQLFTDPGDLVTNFNHDILADESSNVIRLQDNGANNIGAGYSWFGANHSATTSRTQVDMIDMNGDGLPDMVWRSSSSVISIKVSVRWPA